MTDECNRVNGINMAQGLCDLPIPPSVLEGVREAMAAGHNQYGSAKGLKALREEIARDLERRHGDAPCPEQEIVVSPGATGALTVTARALLNPGDEVVLFEPMYGYHRATLEDLGCVLHAVRMDPPEWTIDRAALEEAITERTRAIVLSTPSNPSGKILGESDLDLLADVAERHDLILFSDEIYDHFVYDGKVHRPPRTHPGLRERTVTLGGFSKIFAITGWRIGYAVAPPEVAAAAAAFNDLIYVCPPTPLQHGVARGLAELPPDFYQNVAREHQHKRDQFCDALREAGLPPVVPEGAYYVMADISALPGADDLEKVRGLLQRTGIAAVPGRAFYLNGGGESLARFCFAKQPHVLQNACDLISQG